MNKQLFEYSKRILLKNRRSGSLKLTSLPKSLYFDYQFGTIVSDGGCDYLQFDEDDRASLIRKVNVELELDLLTDEYLTPRNRIENSATQRNEKVNSYAVSRDFILINSLNGFNINQGVFPKSPVTSLGIYIKADQINSIEHTQIVFVENLEIMANLDSLNLPHNLNDALWLYRGDKKAEQKTSTAYDFFRRFQGSHQLICFSDLDPKGIEIALTCGADYWLTAEDSNVINIPLKGVEKEWDSQGNSISYLNNRAELPNKCRIAFETMKNNRKTLKQEHMVTHKVKLEAYEL